MIPKLKRPRADAHLRMRVTAREKRAWARAAKAHRFRKLAPWIRRVLNDAVYW